MPESTVYRAVRAGVRGLVLVALASLPFLATIAGGLLAEVLS